MVIESQHPTVCKVVWCLVNVAWILIDILATWGVLAVLGLSHYGIGGAALIYLGIRWLVGSFRNHGVEIEFAGKEKDNDKEGE